MDNLHEEVEEKNKVGKNKPTYTASQKEQMVTLLFKQNRSYELRIGQNFYCFGPSEKVQVPADVIKHPDFESQKIFFEILN